MFLAYSELLNSLDAGVTTKVTINNRRLNRVNFEQTILMPLRGDKRDVYRKEYNKMLMDKATEGNGIIQEKYVTITVMKKDVEEARAYFARTLCVLPVIWAKITPLPVSGSALSPIRAAECCRSRSAKPSAPNTTAILPR